MVRQPHQFVLYTYRQVDSTINQAVRLAETESSLRYKSFGVTAQTQTGGRGKAGRSWSSPVGNCYVTLAVWLPRETDQVVRSAMPDWSQLVFVSAIAVVDTIQPWLRPQTLINCKWPNDILLEERKVCGILLEKHSLAWADQDLLVIGIGLNVAICPEVSDANFPPTCLQDYVDGTLEVSRINEALGKSFAQHYERWQQEGFADYRQRWTAMAYRLQQTLTVANYSAKVEETLTGVFQGLDGEGKAIMSVGDREYHLASLDVMPPVAVH